MKLDITVEELKQEKTLLAFDSNLDDCDVVEVELFFSKKLRKFSVLKSGKLIKTTKTPIPCIQEFKMQVRNNNLDTIKKFD